MAAPETELSATGRVILGMLSLGKSTGYDIKQFVDKSTRHFWAASYGQIYPELKRLEDQGLVRSRPEPAGARARTVFELTDAGRQTLQEWLESTAEPLYEFRCETLLKIFFSDAADPESRIQNLRTFVALQERKLEQLRAIEPAASASANKGPYMSLQFGIAMTEWMIDWCQNAEARLTGQATHGAEEE
jgi:DNA-binding PadR family transcriptional regulator